MCDHTTIDINLTVYYNVNLLLITLIKLINQTVLFLNDMNCSHIGEKDL